MESKKTSGRNKDKGYFAPELIVTITMLSLLCAVALKVMSKVDIESFYQFTSSIDTVAEAAVKYAEGHKDTGISIALLCSDGYIDDETVCGAGNDGVGANPWGGNYTITVNSLNGSRFDVSSTAVPVNVGPKVVNYYNGVAITT